MSSVTSVVETFLASPDQSVPELVSTLKAVALNDPVLCGEIAGVIRKKLYSHIEAEQVRAITLLDALMDSFDLTFRQIVHEKPFLSALEKIISRDESAGSCPKAVADQIKALFSKWVVEFSSDADLLPNFQTFHARLVEQGVLEPLDTLPQHSVGPVARTKTPMMDQYLLNEAEGQDPEEFKTEVKATLKLFDEIYSNMTKVRPTSALDEVSRKDALMSVAANLDRYSEQFGLWIEQLEPGEYMEEAMRLNDGVTEALQKYKKLRSGVVKSLSYESSDSESSSSSSDEDD